MSNSRSIRKKVTTTSSHSSTPPPNKAPSAVVFSLRLPASLRVAADKYASSTGVSLNGLVCIALADYLASRGHQVKS